MTTNSVIFTLLISCLALFLILLFMIDRKIKKSQLKRCFLYVIMCMLICLIGLILQSLLGNKLNIPLICYDYIVYIGTCFLPVALFFTSLSFINTKLKVKRLHLLLFIIPVISLLVLWTNDLHHLFYKKYSINLNETITGPYTTIHFIYTYSLFAISIINLLRYSIKNAGFFSRQSILIVIGALIPIVINILGTFNIIPMTIYITPICFAFTVFFFALAIFKFDFLKITPIAMQRVVDRMSDSFLVVNENGIITDFNDTFLKAFHIKADSLRNIDFIEFMKSRKPQGINEKFIKSIFEKTKTTEKTILVKREMKIKDNYFNIEASGIFSDKTFLGTLILIKDVTQHMQDMETIQENQNMLMERERLASLGQLIGGIAHNLKTPIMSISGAAEGISDLVKEYDASIGDKEVTENDHHEIAHDMKEWTDKIKSYTEYMSDIITAVKGQAVTMSAEQAVSFDIEELMKRVNILMRHELKNALITLNFKIDVPSNTTLRGNINSLVQVINNMISNSIQAYNGEANKEIDLIVDMSKEDIIISIKDYAGGLPKDVQEKLFKEMITTKGKNGTGLGLFMSYSTIRAHFNGNITFETEKGKGTTFHISLPK